jgi:ABC-type amino acid transport substrate-binding protein
MRVSLVCSLCWLILLPSVQAETFPLYTYHGAEPFIIGAETGLSEHFVEHFNRLSDAKLQFKLTPIERTSLNQKVAANENIFILWGNALWFSKLNPHLQSSEIIFWDSDIVVSLADTPLMYSGPESLWGKRFTALAGHVYFKLEEAITQNKIQRISSPDNLSMLALLTARQVDAMITTHSTVLYWQRHKKDFPAVYISLQHYDEYSRHILTTPGLTAYLPAINQTLEKMRHDQQWLALLEYYGIFTLLDPFNLELDELQKVQ